VDLSNYPSTKKGVEALVQDLTPTIADLWKIEREDHTDDLVAIIDAHTNRVSLKARTEVHKQLKKFNPNVDILKRIEKPASKPNGTVRIWTIIGFSNGKVCALPMVLARS